MKQLRIVVIDQSTGNYLLDARADDFTLVIDDETPRRFEAENANEYPRIPLEASGVRFPYGSRRVENEA